MNYLHMIAVKEITTDKITSFASFQCREEVFREQLNFIKIVPIYLVLEACFQTAGRLARALTNNRMGAYVVSFNRFDFKRPVFANEILTFTAYFRLQLEEMMRFKVSIDSEGERILSSGEVILKQTKQITNEYLNNTKGDEINALKERYIYNE